MTPKQAQRWLKEQFEFEYCAEWRTVARMGQSISHRSLQVGSAPYVTLFAQ